MTEVDSALRVALAAQLAPIADHLSAVTTQEVGIGRNVNQQARFLNGYGELPAFYGQELAALNHRHEVVLTELRRIRQSLDALVRNQS